MWQKIFKTKNGSCNVDSSSIFITHNFNRILSMEQLHKDNAIQIIA